MTEPKTKDFNEYLLENVQAAREETREFKNDINKRMDGIEKRMDRIENRMDKLEDKIDKLSDKLDTSMKEIRELVTSSQKEMNSSMRHSQILTSTIVSLVIVIIASFIIH